MYIMQTLCIIYIFGTKIIRPFNSIFHELFKVPLYVSEREVRRSCEA